MLARLKSQGSLGFVPFGPGVPSPSGSISSPFVTPSPSQSASAQIGFVKSPVVVPGSQGSAASVPSSASCASVIPSPSVSMIHSLEETMLSVALMSL